MSNELIKQEVQKAVFAGERALQSLYAAKEQLNSAKNWGILDMLGGGFFSGLIKHSRIKESSTCLEQAKYDLRLFQKQLYDAPVSGELHIDINGFLSFADFFFDGLIADYLVQSKINDAREQVDDAIERVSYLLSQLKN